MAYQTLQIVSSAISALIFLSVIVAMLAYALWPGNAQKFNRAAHLPLEDGAPMLAPDQFSTKEHNNG